MGGPLVAVSAVAGRGGCTEQGTVGGDGDAPDDYDRACAVDDVAGVVPVGRDGGRAPVLGDLPVTSPPRAPGLPALGRSRLRGRTPRGARDGSRRSRRRVGGVRTWETDGPAVLMDSAQAGGLLGVGYPGGGMPAQAPVPLPAGRWAVQAVGTTVGDRTSLGLVRLVPDVR